MNIRSMAIALCICATANVSFAFDLQGHRGARGLLPENTLPAFAKALSIGVTTLELDTVVTKDGVVVVSHNPVVANYLARGADGKWLANNPLIKDLTFEELQKFDVGRLKPGSRAAERFKQQQPVDGTRMPSLEQVFELTKAAGNTSVRFNIETKIDPRKPDRTPDPKTFATAVLNVITKFGLEDRSSVQSFDWRTLQEVQKANPNIETVYLTAQQDWLNNVGSDGGKSSAWTAGFNLDDVDGDVARLVKSAGGDVWSPFFRDLDPDKVKNAQMLGLKVIPWTINDEKAMAALIKMGVDGIITDYPDKLRKVMETSGLPLPKPTPVQP